MHIEANEIICDAEFMKHGKVSDMDGDEGTTKVYEGSIHPEKFSPTVRIEAENGQVQGGVKRSVERLFAIYDVLLI